MAKVKIDFGVEADIATPAEVRDGVRGEITAWEAARLRGIKHMRLPETLRGTAEQGVLSLSELNSLRVGPDPGYAWSISRLVVTGLTPGATPDIVNLYRSATTGTILWQFNGNHFGYSFSKLQLTLYGGDTLALRSVGPFLSTDEIILGGELIQAPAELLAKLA